jgi:hypothetical protein
MTRCVDEREEEVGVCPAIFYQGISRRKALSILSFTELLA